MTNWSIYPDTILRLNGHRVILSAYEDPVRRVLLGDLEEVYEIVFCTRHDRARPGDGGQSTSSAPSATGTDEHRSQPDPGPATPPRTEALKSSGCDGRTVAGDGSVTPEVTPDTPKPANSDAHVAEVAEPAIDNTHFSGATPHHEPELALLLDEVASTISRYVSLRVGMMYAEAVALWIVGTHVFQWSNIFPRLVATSPEPGCGKITLMKVMLFLCPDAVLSSNATEAAIVRRIKRTKQKIVLLLDDAENFVDGSHTSLLNAGFDRYGGQFLRCQPSKAGKWEDEEFNPYVPIAMARISKTPVKSTRTRCLEINIQRAKKGELFQRFEPDIAKSELETLRDKLAKWAVANGDQLKACDPPLPETLANRNADVWRFFLAIADLGGVRWSRCARDAAVAITRNTSEDDPGFALRNALARVLAAVRDQAWLTSKDLSWEKLGIYEIASGELRIPSAGLCVLLCAVSQKHSNLKQTKLAALLAPFDVHSGPINMALSACEVIKKKI